MRVLFAAKDGFKYNRTHILAEGLKAIGSQVDYFKIPERSTTQGRVLRDLSLRADVVIVPPFRHRDLGFVKRYSKSPVVFDPLISRYLTKVVDYGHYWKAPQKWLIDRRDFKNCDLLLADTQAHLNYFKKTFYLPTSLKTGVLPLGVNLKDFKTKPPHNDTNAFHVGFYGSFVPLQGVLKIIEAISLIKDVKGLKFTIIGTGYQYKAARELASSKGLSDNIFKGWVPYETLPSEIEKFDLGLGVFGDSMKADMVVPNKLYHYAASAKAILSKDSPGMREVFSPGINLAVCEPSPQAIADNILMLKNQRAETMAMGKMAHRLMEEQYGEEAIAQKFLQLCGRI